MDNPRARPIDHADLDDVVASRPDRARCAAEVNEQTIEADRLELELMELTARFCRPLRGRGQPLLRASA